MVLSIFSQVCNRVLLKSEKEWAKCSSDEGEEAQSPYMKRHSPI
jgi:hypothetical protein